MGELVPCASTAARRRSRDGLSKHTLLSQNCSPASVDHYTIHISSRRRWAHWAILTHGLFLRGVLELYDDDGLCTFGRRRAVGGSLSPPAPAAAP
jgi:hypothetical protein